MFAPEGLDCGRGGFGGAVRPGGAGGADTETRREAGGGADETAPSVAAVQGCLHRVCSKLNSSSTDNNPAAG
jgi:hypothetical protein